MHLFIINKQSSGEKAREILCYINRNAIVNTFTTPKQPASLASFAKNGYIGMGERKVFIMFVKKLTLILLSLIVSGWARGTGPEAARQAGMAWLLRVPEFHDIRPQPGLRAIHDAGRTTVLAWLQELEPGGFLLIAPDERLPPILGFSFSARFDTSESPENHLLMLLRRDMPRRLAALADNSLPAEYLRDARARWQELSTATEAGGYGAAAPVTPPGVSAPSLPPPPAAAPQTALPTDTAPLPPPAGAAAPATAPAALSWAVETGPFLTSRWDQGSDSDGQPVFNYYTPNQWPCGCVATAMSQILYYHRWPLSGTGHHSYAWGGTTLSADFSAAAYDWAHMVADYSQPGGEPLSNRQAAGWLTSHSGISVEMNYAAAGSGALVLDVPGALGDHFRHHGLWVDRSAADFFTRLYDNMLNGRPALIAIFSDNNAGHAVVADGVRHESGGIRYYHINLGWGGYADAWYDLSGPWSAGGYLWSTIDGAVMDVLPLPDLEDPGAMVRSSHITLRWNPSSFFAPEFYELQQASLDPALASVSDGAESGMGNWLVSGNWKTTTAARRSGSWAFKGYIAEAVTASQTFSALELNRAVRIDGTTRISYWWGAYYFHGTTARLEISDDEQNWMPVTQHTSTTTSGTIVWNSVSLSPSDLAAWIGRTVTLRFVIDLTGNSYYYGTSVGFYLDDFRLENAALGTWTTVDENITGSSAEVNVTSSGAYAWRVRPHWNGQWWPWSDAEQATVELPQPVTVRLRAFLQGPWAGSGLMATWLRSSGALPLSSPYAEAPATAALMTGDIVDWLLVQLYETDGLTLAASASALLRRDGQIVNMEGSIDLRMDGLYRSKSYFAVVRHRNHAAVMSAAPLSFSGGGAAWDFTTGIDKYSGSGGAVRLAEGAWGLWAGDVDRNGRVEEADYALWRSAAQAGSTGYQTADLRLDGRVTTADYLVWYENRRAGAGSALPAGRRSSPPRNEIK